MNERIEPASLAPELPGPFAPDWSLVPHYRQLPPEFYTLMAAEGVSHEPVLVHANASAAALIDLEPALFRHPDFPRIFSGQVPVSGFEPLAMVYSGHQFGNYVPRLGDGRALLIAQVRNRRGELWDVQLKGAGLTPYSRFADGRAVMRSTIREYLCSEAMASLGIPTTRALAIVATGESVQRETWEPGAVLTRLSPSHVRFGHFEYFHYSERPLSVRRLADHVIAEHFPHLAGQADSHALWFAEVVARTARLIAAWQAVGFAHGVMNTDYMSVLGLTIDYGPFGFMEAYDPGFICNHSDPIGRYAFDQQPAVGLWNLTAFAVALTSLIPAERLNSALETYHAVFTEELARLMRAKLGLADARSDDTALVEQLLQVMADSRADYSLTFRSLARTGNPEGDAAWLALFSESARATAQDWLSDYSRRVADTPMEQRRAVMDRVNPTYVLRNWVAETAIRAVEDRGDIATLDRIFRLVQSPFDEHPGAEEFAMPAPCEMQSLCVSCSS
jgi:uncharacterized protein YdiU (UPF0061 family)